MGRAPCCDKANVKKGPWSPEEDAKLKSYIEQQGTGGNWIALPQKIGLKRCGKSCRLRWLNYLRPNLKHGGFSEEEDNIICSLYISIGSRWSIIAAQLPGRTDNDIKNYWNTRLKKKLLGKQRKEQHARRGSSSIKQEMRKERANLIVSDNNNNNNNNNNSNNNNNNQSPYWPELSLMVPTQYSNQDTRPNDHTSIRKLLIKLGGRFSSDHDQQLTHIDETNLHHLPIDVSSIPTPYDYSINNVLNANATQVLENTHYSINGTGLHMLPGQSNFQAELEELVYNNPEKLNGMEFLYEDMMVNSRNGTSHGEGIDWCGMSSMVFPQVSSSYGLQQGMLQDCAYDELRYTSVAQ